MIRWLRNFFRSPSRAMRSDVEPAGVDLTSTPGAQPDAVSPAVSNAASGPDVNIETTTCIADPAAVMAPTVAVAPATAAGISWLVREDINANFSAWLFARSDYADLQTTRAEQAILT
ncbi:MAG: hypothetical protein H7244_08795, partial [Herminiimonas sp.]|nr:hypothetical protein [Herminiimonas sp.]